LAATILFVYLGFHGKGERTDYPVNSWRYWRPFQWISGFLDKLASGVGDIGRSRFFYSSFGISLFLLLGQILSYWFVMRAYGLTLSFWQGAAVFLIVHIGTVIPSAPSNVGTYQFFSVLGLTLFGIDKTLAVSFSVVVFLILTIPLWGIGLLVFGRLGLSLKKIQTDISSMTRN
jgi:glycosyltransferase 2 family protein